MNKEKSPQKTPFNSQKYFQHTLELLNGITPKPENEHVYPLGGATEWIRMELQNNLEYDLFGAKHKEHHLHLAELGFSPERIAIIGIDPHGVMVKNIQEAYPNAQKIAIDLNSEKITQAKSEIDKLGEEVKNKFEWFVGDATQILPSIEKVDLVDAQLVLIWGRNRAPLFYNPSNGPFPTRQMLTESISNCLNPGGLATINDLIARDWHLQPSPGFEDDEDVLESVSVANIFISSLWKIGWEQTGGISWESDRQLIETVEKESLNVLKINAELSTIFDFPISKNTDPLTCVYALMTPAANDMVVRTMQQVIAALNSSWPSDQTKEKLHTMLLQLNEVAPKIKSLAEEYVKATQDPRVQTVPAPMAALVFQK